MPRKPRFNLVGLPQQQLFSAPVFYELVLGRSYFKDKIEEMAKRKTRLGQPGRPRVEEEEAVYLVRY